MRRFSRGVVAALCISISTCLCAGSSLADSACGPLYCQNDPHFSDALQAKKSAMSRAGYPNRLIVLLDEGGQCFVCVGSGSPDIFSLLPVDGNVLNLVPWDENNERIAKARLGADEIKSYYIYNTRKACTCCGEPKAEQRSDCNSELDLNRDTAIKCVRQSDNNAACE